jgi:hypothetical protein
LIPVADDPIQPVPYATPAVGQSKRGQWVIILLLIGLICTLAVVSVLGYLLLSGKQVQISTNVTPAPPTPPAVVKVTPTLSKNTVEFAVYQRRTAPVPGSNNTVMVHLDDITGGQVLVSVIDANGQTLMPATSLKEGAAGTFTLGKATYDVAVKDLRNKMVGSDFGVIAVGPTTAPAKR